MADAKPSSIGHREDSRPSKKVIPDPGAIEVLPGEKQVEDKKTGAVYIERKTKRGSILRKRIDLDPQYAQRTNRR